MKKNNKIRVFIKVHRSGNAKNAFTCITMGENGKVNRHFSTGLFDKDISKHRIILEAIRSYLSNIKIDIDNHQFCLVVYADSDEIAYEWKNEYLSDGKFVPSTQDKDLYEEIIKLLNKHNLNMEVIGKDNVLSTMKKII